MGSIMVNEAPLATLTASNSVVEVKCAQNVMGIKMTEEIRKLAAFFTKKFPLDVHERHIKKPEGHLYLKSKFAVVLGGQFANKSELIDRILLANQLSTQASRIMLVGEFGLAAVSTLLNMPVCKVEGSSLDYREVSRFFKTFFRRARGNGCELVFPTDFVVA